MAQNQTLDENDFPSALQRFLTNILNKATDGITAQDKTGKLIYANATAARITGYPSAQAMLDAKPGEIINQFELFDEDNQVFPLNQLPGRMALEGKESPGVVLKFRVKATGEESWSYVQSAPVFDKDGKVEYVVNTFHDISSLKERDAALREREARYRNLVENANDMIFTLDSEGRFVTINRAGEALIGYMRDEVAELSLRQMVFEDDFPILETLLHPTDADSDQRHELRLWRKDGQPRVLEISTTVLSHGGQAMGIQGIGRDITERKRFETKRRFLAEASKTLASSLDYETTLKNIAELITPEIADWSSVDMLDENGEIKRVTVSHVDPEKVALAYQIQREYPIDMSVDSGLPKLLRDGITQYYPDIPDALLEAGARDERHLYLLRQIGFRSGIVVPIIAHGKIYGGLTLVTSTESGRLLNQADVLTAEEVGRMAGLALENALAYREAELERERLRVTLTSIGDAVIATDVHGNVNFLNTVAESLTGWSNKEALGRPLTEVFNIINEHSRKVVENPVSIVLETGHIVGLANHTILIARDKREIPIEDSAAPIRDSNNAVRGVVLVFRDVTEERKARNELETARRNAEDAVERLSQLQLLTSVLSRTATIQQIAHVCISESLGSLGANMGMVALFSKDGSLFEIVESSIKSPSEPYFGTLPLDVSQPIADSAKTGRAIWIPSQASFHQHYPELFADKSKAFRSHSYVSLPLIIEDRVIGSIGFNFLDAQSFDEDERAFLQAIALQCAQALERARLYEAEMLAREESEKANQLKMQFLTVISHELRNPLTKIQGSITALLGTEPRLLKAEEQASLISVINEASEHLEKLVSQLLDLSHLQAGTLHIEPANQSIETIINAAMPEMQNLKEDRHLVVYVEKNLPEVFADTRRIVQVLLNLVSNAVKFSPENTYITIVASQLGDYLQVDVSDEGEGIPLEERASVFEAFHQTGRKSAETSGGARLSLAICKAIVEAHRGNIWVQDKVVGTTISFNLPTNQAD